MEFVKVDLNDHVATVTIDRPKALNALNTTVLEELKEAFESLDLNIIRAVILTGGGEKSFVAGADIAQMASLTKEEAVSFGKKGNAVFRMIETFPAPVIAAVNGFALGGGCELAMCCDIRIASENAIFAQPEVGLGITAGFGGTQRLARLVAPGLAKELLYTTNKIDAQKACAVGLVNAVYAPEELLPAAQKLAAKIARNAPIAVRATKKAINDGLQTDIDSAIDIEANLFGSCFKTEDQQEGMAAFLEKRKVEGFKNC